MWAVWVHHSWRSGHEEALREVGSEMPERGSKTSTVPVVWATSGVFFCATQMMDETWLYHYDPETKQKSMEWRHSGSPRPAPKISGRKNHCKSFRLDCLVSRRHPPHWLPSKCPNYQRGILRISAGATEGYFEGETPLKVHQGCLVLARQCLGSPGTCNPEETGLPGLPVSWSPTLFSGSGPVCSLD